MNYCIKVSTNVAHLDFKMKPVAGVRIHSHDFRTWNAADNSPADPRSPDCHRRHVIPWFSEFNNRKDGCRNVLFPTKNGFRRILFEQKIKFGEGVRVDYIQLISYN